MEASKLKNMVILQNLPSNIVDEAIIVLKNSTKIEKVQKTEKNKKTSITNNIKKDKDYILKEAEMLINAYISKIENKEKKENLNKKTKVRYEKLKKYSIVITIMSVIQTIVILFR